MKIESFDHVLLNEAGRAFEQAKADTLADAVDRAHRYAKTGKFMRSLMVTETREADGSLVAHVGSPLVSAKAHEKGAFIQAKGGGKLVFTAGGSVRKVDSVRLRPQPTVTPAGRQFGEHLVRRLRELRG